MILKNAKINMPQSLIFMKLPNLDTADIKCFTVILHNMGEYCIIGVRHTMYRRIFTFLVYLLKNPIVNYWNVIEFTYQ